jgi:hypothetical protein
MAVLSQRVLIFDVNETLTDFSPLAARFTDPAE